MGIIAEDMKSLAGESKDSSSRFGEDFYGRFKQLDLNPVKEVREIREG